MSEKIKKTSKFFWVVITTIVVIAVLVWVFWSNVEVFLIGNNNISPIISSTEYTAVDVNLREKVLLKLKSLKQYGQWPILAVRETQNRGNPFEQKK